MASIPMSYHRNYNSSDSETYTSAQGYTVLSIQNIGWTAKEGCNFKEWNTRSDGLGVSREIGSTIIDDDLYAIWEEIPYDVTISYKGSTIATMSSSGTKTLNTSGTYCEDDITIDYTKTGITVVETLDPNGGTIVSISGDPVTSLQAKTVIPTSQSQTISADSGYDAISEVLVQGDSNLIGSNIASGVSIFGVVGTFAGGGEDLKNFIEQYNTITSFSNSEVSTIGGGAFACCDNLTTVNFPSCTSIGSMAFVYCYSLTTVSFPSCTNIGDSAFQYCSNLITVSFSSCTYIGSYAFQDCFSLTTVSFPSCTNIGDNAFAHCYSLATVDFPSCTSIGSNAFQDCSGLTTMSFPLCTSVNDYAFAFCTSLTTVDIPLCTSIGNGIFYNCYSLTTVDISLCTSIGSYAFAWCSNLTTVSFSLCTSIGGYAFQSCSSLATVSLPLCMSIGIYAFQSCHNLATVSFPSCTDIGSSAFRYCYSLVSLYLTGSSVARLWNSNAFSSTPIARYTTSTGGVYGSIFVPSSLYSTYIASTNWTYFSSRIVSV